ncbi:MAG: response regulator [Chitinophagaceae bacterium]|nr:response regulator [Chitinophagaceae bacterium]
MKKRILAIDDSKAIRFLLQTVLGKDFQMVTAPDGGAAMYWLSKNGRPDLIIADPELPDMDNWELIAEFSDSILYRDIPLLAISSLDKEQTREKCAEYGVKEYFMKPFNPLTLLETVNKLVNGAPAKSAQPTSIY